MLPTIYMTFRRINVKELEKMHNLMLAHYLVLFSYLQKLEALRETDTENEF
jgi:hypothetical protein